MEQIHLYSRDELAAMSMYELRDLVEAAQVAHVTDVQTIADLAHAEAERRSYCATYDEIVAVLDGQTAVPFPKRQQRTQHVVSYTIPITGTWYVNALDEEDAVRLFNENFPNGRTAGAVRDMTYNQDYWRVGNVTAEESD